ncbi:MAG: hypothetical protein LBD03_05690 [Methanobrevibacter sp.]|jgi:hypothetical protein|nr:hypothetical protein [Candidatus Methanovirga procula]
MLKKILAILLIAVLGISGFGSVNANYLNHEVYTTNDGSSETWESGGRFIPIPLNSTATVQAITYSCGNGDRTSDNGFKFLADDRSSLAFVAFYAIRFTHIVDGVEQPMPNCDKEEWGKKWHITSSMTVSSKRENHVIPFGTQYVYIGANDGVGSHYESPRLEVGDYAMDFDGTTCQRSFQLMGYRLVRYDETSEAGEVFPVTKRKVYNSGYLDI